MNKQKGSIKLTAVIIILLIIVAGIIYTIGKKQYAIDTSPVVDGHGWPFGPWGE